MNRRSITLIIIFTIILMFVAGCVSLTPGSANKSLPPNLPVSPTKNLTQSSPEEDLFAFVNEADVYTQRVGKDAAIKEFSNPNGSFIRGELYIWAYDFNGVNLAHPYHQEFKGQNKLSLTDSEGVRMIEMMLEAARNGSGFVEYQYPNPVTGGTESKLAYVKRVDDTWWLASGIYGTDFNIPQEAPEIIRDVLRAKVDYAASFARESGKEEALSVFNNVSGPFTLNGSYIFAFDMNGTTLALPFYKDRIGKDESNLTDPNGVGIGREKLLVAKQGGGFYYYIFNNPDNFGKPEFKVAYVEPVDSSWVVGAGTYLPLLPALFKKESRDNLVSHVNNAADYVVKNGRESAIREFNDMNSNFSRKDMFIFAFDRNGTLLANPYLPGIVGLNRLSDVDPYGEYPVKHLIANALNGGGFTYYFFPDPAANYSTRLKLGYTKIVDDSLIVGAGIFPD